MTVGQSVTITRDVVPWYSGYGVNPYVILPAGTVGTVTHVDVPPVRGKRSYNVARFTYEGQSWQTTV